MKHFTLPTLVFLVIANMLGAGVFTTSGFALADLGSASAVLLAWCIGGGVALCGAVSYGLLARKITDSGGEYVFLRQMIHPVVGFVGGMLSIVVGFAGATAFAAMTLELYLGVPLESLRGGIIATLVVVGGWLMHALHINAGSKLQNALVVAKLVALMVFVIYAFGAHPLQATVLHSSVGSFSWLTMATTLMWVSFSYSGFNAAVYVSGEVSNAAVNVPRALIIGTSITVVFYIALNAAFVCVPPLSSVSGQGDIALRAANFVGGPAMMSILRIIIVLALFTSISSLFMAGPRVCMKMADDGMLPFKFYSRKKSLLLATTLQAMLVLMMIWFSHLRELLSYLGMTLALSTMITVSTLFKLYPVRGFRSAVRLIVPSIFIILTAASVVLAGYNKPYEALASAITLFISVVAYYIFSLLDFMRSSGTAK